MRKIFIAAGICFYSISLPAQSDDAVKLKEKIAAAIDKVESRCITWRKQIHQYPELGNSQEK